jgi:uncharacterized protein Yka (UPF0111/DUF47 family)
MAVKAAENASPEKKLERAREAADAAAEAADNLKKSYEDLKTSLNSIGDASKDIKNLTYGTDEWKEAVEKLND